MPNTPFFKPLSSSLALVAMAFLGGSAVDMLPLLADETQELTRALSFKPRQPDVNYEKVAPEDVTKCKLEKIARDDGKGFWVTGPAGQPLRWFVDTNGDKSPDRWCYYNEGVEVYRESDTDFNGTADEFRWLNTEGMRWGIDKNEDGVIDSWRIISAEEVTAEVIAALANNDVQRFQRLLLSESELRSLGLGDSMIQTVQDRIQTAQQQFPAWMAQQKTVTPSSRWTNFGADRPGIVPAGTDKSTKDVVVYENAVALFEDAGQAKQLIVGSMIQVDGAWRLASLPRLIGDQSNSGESGVFFPTSYTSRGAGQATESSGGLSRALESLVNELQDIDGKLITPGNNTAALQNKRADVLEKLVSHSESEADRNVWIEQFADTVSAAAQVGDFPRGIERIEQFLTKLKATDANPNAIAYVAFRKITAHHNMQMQEPGAKYDQLNDAYLSNLKDFIREFPNSEDSADAMLQIALAAEFTGDPKEASKWYSQAASSFASTSAGKKATGAMRRLNLQGKPFAISGQTLDNRPFNSSAYRGGPVIYHCWASWCDSCKADMRALQQLQAKYAKQKLRVVGLNLDNDRKAAEEFLKQNSLSWVNVHDAGGLESNLAIGYGILTLPVNIIVDKDGNVIKSGAHWTELDRILEQMMK